MSVTNEEIGGKGNGGSGTPSPAATPANNPGQGNIYYGHSPSVLEDVVKAGYLRKLKGRRKYFVLRRDSETGPARLEYFVKESKFLAGQPPRKSISLKACFDINKTDSKCKYAIALHTHNDCVRIAMSSEEEMNEWLGLLTSLCFGGEDEAEELATKPHFEHVWYVTALNKGIGGKENIVGPYRLCLTSKELTLFKVGDHDERNGQTGIMKFPLNVIKTLSHDTTFGCVFHIEFGRLAPWGAGLLSLKTEDNNIAQNMHLLILKTMQNSTKEDQIPPMRERRPTWTTESRSIQFNNTPPVMTRGNSVGGCMRIRADSVSSSERRGESGISPPVLIHPTPAIAFNSPQCSTDSASSSYSCDNENNNNINHSRGNSYLGLDGYSKSQEDVDESYVPWNPGEEAYHTKHHPLHLPLQESDYVDTTVIGLSQKPRLDFLSSNSYGDIQSPTSPYESYIQMSPGGAMTGGSGSVKSSGKVSVSHSRNSSLIEEHEGYVPMIPGVHHSRSESGPCSMTGSTNGLDDSYLDMDFHRKLNLSSDDMRRSPVSSESIQSGTPSSDYPLEKVSSYLQSEDYEDLSLSMRPARAYSVGSRSDSSSVGKPNIRKNRLDPVQENFRIRAMSVGSKQAPRRSSQAAPIPTSVAQQPSATSTTTPLSSSWSGSTGRWPVPKYPSPSGFHPAQPPPPQSSYTMLPGKESDPDLMELDFSHNSRKNSVQGRKRSLPGPASLTPSGSSGIKISPIPKGILACTPPGSGSGGETPDGCKSFLSSSSASTPKYPCSAPILIQKNKRSLDGPGGYVDSGSSILTQLARMDLNQLKELDAEGAYLDMDFSQPKGQAREKPVVVKAKECSKPVNFPSAFHHPPSGLPCSEHQPGLSRSLSSSSNLSTTSNNSNSSDTSCILAPNQPTTLEKNSKEVVTSPTGPSSLSLSRIEESPEKTPTKAMSPRDPPLTYASIQHGPVTKRSSSGTASLFPNVNLQSGGTKPVNYSKIDFAKSAEVKNN